MSTRRLGRLLGSLMLLVGLVALPALAMDSQMHLSDYNWQMPVVHSLLP
ncbi:hypothetical protein [Micromonospora musae]|nr:hypothetical protein [Micromonospora musae]